MKIKPSAEDVRLMALGMVVMASVMLVVWHFSRGESPAAQQAALRASRVDLVGRLQLALSMASEAAKSSVLATTDQDSRAFANQAREATAEADRDNDDLGKLLTTGGTPRERELLAQFDKAFVKLKRIDDDLLRLAVKDTNLKAYRMAFGPAADTLAEMDAALSRVVAKSADSPDGKRVMLLAFGARIEVLRIQTLLAPHIAEETDIKMDRLEALMIKEEIQVRKGLDDLSALPNLKGDTDLKTASSLFLSYCRLKARILALSRENTNVQSGLLSLHQKRKAMVLCMDGLNTLRQAILEEPTRGEPTYPR
jgi:hypothetical protein